MGAGLTCWEETSEKRESEESRSVQNKRGDQCAWERASEASPFMACGPTESSCCSVSLVLVLAVLELEVEVVIGSEDGWDSRVWLCL